MEGGIPCVEVKSMDSQDANSVSTPTNTETLGKMARPFYAIFLT